MNDVDSRLKTLEATAELLREAGVMRRKSDAVERILWRAQRCGFFAMGLGFGMTLVGLGRWGRYAGLAILFPILAYSYALSRRALRVLRGSL